jgi:hypothetical protein
MNEELTGLDKFTTWVILFGLGFIFGVIVASKYNRPPVEKSNTIDSLSVVNDSIKVKVELLDSIKNAKVIEVSTLDNDSTAKLFYKLVRE